MRKKDVLFVHEKNQKKKGEKNMKMPDYFDILEQLDMDEIAYLQMIMEKYKISLKEIIVAYLKDMIEQHKKIFQGTKTFKEE